MPNFKLPVFDHEWGQNCINKFSIVGDMFCKEINYDLDDNWLDQYKKMREYEPRLVEVYGVENKKIYMQYIDGEILRRKLDLDAWIEACEIAINLTKYAKQTFIPSRKYAGQTGFYFHHDCAPRNFMIENNTNKVYLIDPDSFDFWLHGIGKREADIMNYENSSS